jgi:hypothetical protein
MKSSSVNLAALFVAAGLPEPVLEYRFRGLSGKRRWRFDACWPDIKLALEREGATWTGGRHVRGKGYRSDCQKYSEAAICGWTVIRCTADMMKSGEAITLVEAAFKRLCA